jgi:carbonic anhydrase/acetyltransferase-like protein (isoleucine patch superfamily)
MQQNNILKVPVSSLGYGFIPANQIPKGKDEYYLRNIQNRSGIDYRQLSAFEIEVLVRNRNTSDNWNNILVSDAFNPELVKNCKFYGLVRIGKLEAFYLSFSDLKVPVGLYNSTIISCDLGDNVVVDNVNYLSHYIIGNEVILNNINELVATNHTKFGNGILKTGESEAVRIWMEICNENTGRKVIPFNGMLAGDAYIWSKYKDDTLLQQKLIEITEAQFDTKRGYYGKIGDRTVIKNCSILKDCWIGSDAYIKGANKLKNLTINSGEEGKTQIGEGCEMVNGIIGFGCRAFYGVKAVRFVMASHSQLKYGARLINSYLGNNATISCCEVLNSLIFPAHEQHHNNSFLCAATIMGQSNIAAGATIGSNHNSRGNDGELIAGRGFWPGLCVSLKHNSVFASFTMIAKGDYMHELQIPIPFSLVSNDASKDQLTVMPAFWFQYNMYALERNAWKYVDRDKRIERKQLIEYDYLAPDTIEEIIQAMQLLELFTGKAFLLKEEPGKKPDLKKSATIGKQLLLSQDAVVDNLLIYADGFENSRRKVQLVKVRNAYDIFRQLITYFGANALIQSWRNSGIKSFRTWQENLPAKLKRQQWMNVGGQLMTANELSKLKEQIKKGKLKNWYAVHDQYELIGEQYAAQKNHYGLAVLEEITGLSIRNAATHSIVQLLQQAVSTKEWMCKGIYDSRAKDYSNSFRKMVYDTVAEMNAVLGKLEQNSFIKEQEIQLKQYKQELAQVIKQLGKK